LSPWPPWLHQCYLGSRGFRQLVKVIESLVYSLDGLCEMRGSPMRHLRL